MKSQALTGGFLRMARLRKASTAEDHAHAANGVQWRFRRALIKASIQFYLCVAAALLAALLAWYYLDRQSERSALQQEEVKGVYEAASGLSAFLYEATGDLLFLADQSRLFMQTPASNDAFAELAKRIVTVRRSYDQVRFIDLQGQELVRINYEDGVARRVPEAELQNKSARPYFEKTINLSRGEVYVSVFDLNVERGEIQRPFRPVIRFSTPIYDSAGNKTGMLIINYLGDKLLQRLSSFDRQRQSRLMLVNAQGYWLYSDTLADRWGFQLPHRRNIAEDYPEWESMATRAFGQVFDDKGLLTHIQVGELEASDQEWLEKYTPAGGTRLIFAEQPWQLVSVAEPELLYSESAVHARYATLVLVVLLIALIPVSILWGRKHAQSLADGATIKANLRSLQESEAETSRLLRQNRAITEQLFKTQEEERRFIAHELHDEFGQWLTAIQLKARLIGRLVGDKDPQIRAHIRDISEYARQIHIGIREMINTLRPVMLQELGLQECLRMLVSRWQARYPEMQCELDFACVLCEANESSSVTIYRVVQESLNNIAKYADARHVTIRLDQEGSRDAPERLVLCIDDDGVGMDMAHPIEGMGLANMAERVASTGGELRIDSAPGKGMHITATFPIKGITK
jgi:signal transduction histidine kinase